MTIFQMPDPPIGGSWNFSVYAISCRNLSFLKIGHRKVTLKIVLRYILCFSESLRFPIRPIIVKSNYNALWNSGSIGLEFLLL